MTRHVQIDGIGVNGYVGDAACARQPQARMSVVFTHSHVVKVPGGIDLCRPEKLGWVQPGQHIGGGSYKAHTHQRMTKPQFLGAGHA